MNQIPQSWLLKTPFMYMSLPGLYILKWVTVACGKLCSSFAWCVSSAFGGIKNHSLILLCLLSHVYTLGFLHPYKRWCLKKDTKGQLLSILHWVVVSKKDSKTSDLPFKIISILVWLVCSGLPEISRFWNGMTQIPKTLSVLRAEGYAFHPLPSWIVQRTLSGFLETEHAQ